MTILHVVGYIIIALVLLVPVIASTCVTRDWRLPIIAYVIVAAFVGVIYFGLMLIKMLINS
jgi:hypothetical protein